MIGWFWHRREIQTLTDEVTQLRNEVREPSSETAPTTASVTGNDEEKTEENLRQAQEKSRKLEEELAKAEKLAAVASGHRHFSELHKHERDEKARELEEKTTELEERSEELAKCTEDYNRLQYESGRWHIDRCGTDGEIRDLSVAVQFVALDDRHLAKQITELFSISWSAKKPDQILLSGDDLRDNPCPDSRIVLFSNEERAGHLCFLMRKFNLLNGEKIYDKPKQSDMEDDVTIIIFPEKGSVF